MSVNQSFSSNRDDNFDDLFENKVERLHPALTSTQLFTQAWDGENPSRNNIFYNGFKDCIEVVSEQLKLIFKKLDQQIQLHQIEKKVQPFSASNALIYCEKMLNFGYHEQDVDNSVQNADDLEDTEPARTLNDKWMRAVINIDVVQPIEETKSQSTRNIDSDKESNASKHSRVSETSQWRKTYNSGQKATQRKIEMIPEDPAPVNMQQPQVYDEFEERIRVLKQLECKRKQEMEQQEQKAIEEIKKQQQTFKKEIKGYKFTYDFDGKILNTKGVKSEKLPPANYTVQQYLQSQLLYEILLLFVSIKYTLRDENIIKGKETATSKSVIRSMKEIDSKTNLPNPNLINTDYAKYIMQQQQQAQKDIQQKGKNSNPNNQQPSPQLTNQDSQSKLEKNQPMKIVLNQPSPFEFDSFLPSLGVKLFYDSKIKEGQRYKHDIQDLESLDRQLRMHKENEPIHITKSEYAKLTENGNLNRNVSVQNLTSKKNHQSSNLDQDPSQSKENILSALKYNDFSSALKNNENRRAASLHSSQQLSIKIENPQLIQGLFLDQYDDFLATPSKQEQNKKLPKINVRNGSLPQSTKYSPNDQFNLTLLDDPQWGKGKVGNYYPPEQHIKKPTDTDFRKSVYNLHKLPRERDSMQNKKKQEINQQMYDQLMAKGSTGKNFDKGLKQQFGLKQSFYSTRSALENNFRSTYGNF